MGFYLNVSYAIPHTTRTEVIDITQCRVRSPPISQPHTLAESMLCSTWRVRSSLTRVTPLARQNGVVPYTSRVDDIKSAQQPLLS